MVLEPFPWALEILFKKAVDKIFRDEYILFSFLYISQYDIDYTVQDKSNWDLQFTRIKE